jgi:hypothetical protein
MGQDGSGKGVYARRYDVDGLPLGPEFQVNTETEGDQADSWIAENLRGDLVIVWCSANQDGSGTGIFGQRYNAAGAAQGGEFRVNTYSESDQIYPSIAVDELGGFVVAWQSQSQDGSGFGVYGQQYDRDGRPAGEEFQINRYTSRDQFNPFVAMFSPGRFVIAWISFGQDGSAEGVYGRRFP